MPTKNPRVNITLESSWINLIGTLAQKEEKSVAGLLKELVLEALERREDVALSKIADARHKDRPTTISHTDAWK